MPSNNYVFSFFLLLGACLALPALPVSATHMAKEVLEMLNITAERIFSARLDPALGEMVDVPVELAGEGFE